MKLQSVSRNSRHGVREKAVRRNAVHRKAACLNKLVMVVDLLWLVTTLALLFFYQPGNTRAVEPGDSRQQLAFQAPPAIGTGASNFHQ